MPEGNIFDFTASRILKFEHKWNTDQRKKAIMQRYKSMGRGKPDDLGGSKILERSIAKSERSLSAKTTKSKKDKEDSVAKDAKGKSKDPKSKDAAKSKDKPKEAAKAKKK